MPALRMNMRFSTLAPLALLPVALFVLPTCDTSSPPPRQTTTSSSTSGAGGQGGEAGQGGAGGEGGLGGQGGTAGQGGSGGQTIPYCGDGNLDPGEECDDGNPAGADLCSADCKLVDSEVEPNNSAAQANAWVSPWGARISPSGDVDVVSFVLANPASVVVETRDTGDGACAASALDTVVDVLASDGTTVVGSDDDTGDGLCSRATVSSLPAGTYYTRVTASPSAPSATFPYRLAINVIADICGDTVLTPGEQCDDGNQTSGDGCSSTCKLELTESEPNGTVAMADAYVAPWFSVLSPVGDADFVSFNVPMAGMTITAQTNDAGLGGCAMSTLDTIVTIYAPDGTTELVTNDDALGYCSLAKVMTNVSGLHYVRVKPGGRFTDPSFYGLAITLSGP